MRIQPALPTDAPGIARVQVAGWRAAYREIMPAEVLASLSWEERSLRWEHALSEPRCSILVARGADEAVVGFAMTGPSRDPGARPETGELYALYLHPDRWNTGVGFHLWQASRAALLGQGFRELTLWTLQANRRGRHFYERVGCTLDPDAEKGFEVAGAVLPSVRYRISLE